MRIYHVGTYGVVIAMLGGTIWGITALRSPSVISLGKPQPTTAIPARAGGAGDARGSESSPAPGLQSQYLQWAVEERSSFLQSFRKEGLDEMFAEMLKAGSADHDLPKQSAMRTALASETRWRPANRVFVSGMVAFVEDDRNPQNESPPFLSP